MLIVHGGDGTVNEVVNGVLGECGQVPDADAPAVGVVPGGSANVFARALGISPDPIDATNQLIDLLSEHRRTKSWRRIGLMDCGERWGVFTAGMGVDGDVVAAVEAQRDKGRKVTAARYIRVAVREMLASARKEPSLTLHLPDREPGVRRALRVRVELQPVDLRQHRPVWTNPTTTFETGLGVFATTSMNVWANLRLVRQMLSKKARIRAKHLIRDDDVAVDAGDQRHTGGVPDRRRLPRAAGRHDVPGGPEALGVVAPPAKAL